VSCQSLVFRGPRELAIEESPTPNPAEGQVLVTTLASALSAGSELLVYRGQLPKAAATCQSEIPALRGQLDYPTRFGYSLVGRVEHLGPSVDSSWLGRKVFAFHPHESHFLASPDELMILPEEMEAERAVFLPNMESAVNFVHDGRPLLGERVLVLGQGIVGLLTVALLGRFPLQELVSVDPVLLRRQASLRLGAHRSLAPEEADFASHFDLSFELSGNPSVLNEAIRATGFSGRVVVGSWYGDKRAELDLGGLFHRSRMQIVSSQVSTMNPSISGAWDKSRRLNWALHLLSEVMPEKLITHRFPLHEAARAYQLIDQHPEQSIQVVLTYC